MSVDKLRVLAQLLVCIFVYDFVSSRLRSGWSHGGRLRVTCACDICEKARQYREAEAL